MLQKLYIRRQRLLKDRQMTVDKQGLPVVFHKKVKPLQPYLQFSAKECKRAIKILSNKLYKLELLSSNYKTFLSFDSKDIHLLPDYGAERNGAGRILINNKKKFEKVFDGTKCFLVKADTTNSVEISMCDPFKIHLIYEPIRKFLFDEYQDECQLQAKYRLEPPNMSELQQRGLNEYQAEATIKAFLHPISFIQGPPGCGKTKTVGEICRQLTNRKQKIVVGCASNIANHSLVREIIASISNKVNLVYANYKQNFEENEQYPEEIKRCTIRKKIVAKLIKGKQFNEETRNQVELSIEKSIDNLLFREDGYENFRPFYTRAFAEIVSEADLIIITAISAAKLNRFVDEAQSFKPDVAIIDEASRSTLGMPLCYLTLGCKRIVFVGDQKQLDPTNLNQIQELKESFFDLHSKNLDYFTMLKKQYRMHPKIAEFPKLEFYHSELESGVSQKDRESLIPYFKKYPVSFLAHKCYEQIQNSQKNENSNKNIRHYRNLGEVLLIKRFMQMVPESQLKNVGILTPYELQNKFLHRQLQSQISKGLMVTTSDGYQGGEMDYIILSCVRSNPEGKMGFFTDQRRVNVSLTRARKGLVVIGNPFTLMEGSKSEVMENVWTRYLQYIKQNKLLIQVEKEEIQTAFNQYQTGKQIQLIIQQQMKERQRQEICRKEREQKKKQKEIQEEEEEERKEALQKHLHKQNKEQSNKTQEEEQFPTLNKAKPHKQNNQPSQTETQETFTTGFQKMMHWLTLKSKQNSSPTEERTTLFNNNPLQKKGINDKIISYRTSKKKEQAIDTLKQYLLQPISLEEQNPQLKLQSLINRMSGKGAEELMDMFSKNDVKNDVKRQFKRKIEDLMKKIENDCCDFCPETEEKCVEEAVNWKLIGSVIHQADQLRYLK